MQSTALPRILNPPAVGIVGGAAYWPFVRPWLLRWGEEDRSVSAR